MSNRNRNKPNISLVPPKKDMYEIGKKDKIFDGNFCGIAFDPVRDLANIHGLIFKGIDLEIFASLIKEGMRVSFSLRGNHLIMEKSKVNAEKDYGQEKSDG